MVPWRDRRIPHPEAGPYNWQRQPDNITTSPRPSGGRADAPERAGENASWMRTKVAKKPTIRGPKVVP